MANKGLRVKEGRTTLTAEHLGRDLHFAYPALGPNTYFALNDEILALNDGERPTLAQTASLVDAAWQNSKEKYSKEIIDILRKRWLWGFNGVLYVPKNHDGGKLIEGVYVVDRPEVRNGEIVMEEEDLSKRLKAEDVSVRYVAPGFKKGEVSYNELAKHPLVVAGAGEEGAEKLARVSRNYGLQPVVYVPDFEKAKEPIKRVAALHEDCYGDGLFVGLGFDIHGYCDDGFAFRVLGEGAPQGDVETREASSREILDTLSRREILEYLLGKEE